MFFILTCIYLVNALQNYKICVNCKYFMNDISTTSSGDATFGKCLLFPKYELISEYEKRSELMNFLVSGYDKHNPKKEKEDYYFCTTARGTENMCGKTGKRYEEKFLR